MLVRFFIIQQAYFSESSWDVLFELSGQFCSFVSRPFLSSYDKNDDLKPTVST